MRGLLNILVHFVLLLVSGYVVLAQTNYNHPATGTATQTVTCGSTFNYYDNGGAAGNYSNSMNSTVTFKSSDNTKVIKITFVTFNTEACCDRVRIYDGEDINAPLLATYSGTSLPSAVTSTYGSLTVNFQSDANTVNFGWSALITCETPSSTNISMHSGAQRWTTLCSGNFFDNGGAAANYSNNQDGTFTINNGSANTTLTFTSFDVETHASCGYDYLNIYNGPTTGSPLVGTYCGTSLPPSFSASGPITIRFYSDGGVTRPGWQASWTCCNISPGSISPGSATICSGSSQTLTLSGYAGGASLQWQISTDNATWSNITGATSATYIASPTANRYYRVAVTSGCTSYSGSVLITVNSPSVGGTASASPTSLCVGDATSLTLTGHTGSIQWQRSTDGGATWTNIPGATSTPYSVNPTGNTSYRASVKNGVCASANSTTASVTVNCAKIANGEVTDCGVVNFYDSGGPSGNYGNNEDRTLVFKPNTNGLTISFSAFSTENNYDYLHVFDGENPNAVHIGSYTGTSSPGTVRSSNNKLTFRFKSDANTVSTGWSASVTCCSLDPGSISGATSFCSGSGGTINLTLSGHSGGTSLQWQSATSQNGPWSDITGATSTTYSTTISSSTWYRVRVSSSCVVFTNPVLCGVGTAPSTPPSPTSPANPNCGEVKLIANNPPTGVTYYWQGTNSSGTSTQYDAKYPYYANLSGTYYLRARNNSSGCWSSSSSSIAATVNLPTGGTVSGGTTVCGLVSNSTTLNLSGHSGGTVLRWEKSIAPFTYWEPISHTGTSITINNVTQETRIRAVIKSSSCDAIAFSSHATINVTTTSTANAGEPIYVCTGTTAVLNASGSGTWAVVQGSATVTTPTSPTSTVTGLNTGENVFQWNVSGTCPAYVVIRRH